MIYKNGIDIVTASVSGGDSGKYLRKKSSAEYDTEYAMPILTVNFIMQNQTQTNLPAAEQNLGGDTAGGSVLREIDLTLYTEARLIVYRTNTSAAAGTYLKILYRDSFGFTAGSTLCTSELELNIPSQNTRYVSSWIALVAGAKAEIYLQPRTYGGDGAADPQIGYVGVQFR